MSAPLSNTVSQLRGLTRLGFDATCGVVGLVEQMHRTIGDLAPPFGAAREPRTTGLTGAVYGAIRSITGAVGQGVDLSLRLLDTQLPQSAPSPRREAVVAALNGIWGDHLAASGNPLAITMQLRIDGRPVALTPEGLRAACPQAGGRTAVMLHGLCMNDLQWRRQGHDHGEMLARECGWSVLALHYNSGLPVAANGAQLSLLLETLLAHWPVPVAELALVGHSMGGLVARSAIEQGSSLAWCRRLSRLVCMGTPHEGALLERGGQLVDAALELSPYVAPFARLGKARSAGINDLHDGSVRAPLPPGVQVGLLAATTTAEPSGLRHALIGDGLVTVASAWGEHRDPARALHLPASHKQLITQANHWDLLSDPRAAAALRGWMR
jgi:pimeloyl-ACP methyl ester carboxylesterase